MHNPTDTYSQYEIYIEGLENGEVVALTTYVGAPPIPEDYDTIVSKIDELIYFEHVNTISVKHITTYKREI